jgi:hypothetical protein
LHITTTATEIDRYNWQCDNRTTSSTQQWTLCGQNAPHRLLLPVDRRLKYVWNFAKASGYTSRIAQTRWTIARFATDWTCGATIAPMLQWVGTGTDTSINVAAKSALNARNARRSRIRIGTNVALKYEQDVHFKIKYHKSYYQFY